MRALLAGFFLTAGAALADDCKLPYAENEELRGVIDFSKCLQKRVDDLERENAVLRNDVEDLQKAVANIPGELVNDNGRETRTGGNRLTFAQVSLVPRGRESASFLALDDQMIAEICALGCTVSLLLTAEQLRDTASTPTSVLGPCSFQYNARNGDWNLRGCGSTVSGTDGNGEPAGDSGGEIIASVDRACLLADAEPARSVEVSADAAAESLGRDRNKGLFLIADPEHWTEAEERFRCDLKLVR